MFNSSPFDMLNSRVWVSALLMLDPLGSVDTTVFCKPFGNAIGSNIEAVLADLTCSAPFRNAIGSNIEEVLADAICVGLSLKAIGSNIEAALAAES